MGAILCVFRRIRPPPLEGRRAALGAALLSLLRRSWWSTSDGLGGGTAGVRRPRLWTGENVGIINRPTGR